MAFEADTIKLRDRARECVGADVFDSYLSELEVVEVSADSVMLRVGSSLAREAARRCGAALAGVCGELFASRTVLLDGEGACFELEPGATRSGSGDRRQAAGGTGE